MGGMPMGLMMPSGGGPGEGQQQNQRRSWWFTHSAQRIGYWQSK
jgi:hypothetical protein